jgi:TRAP-type C4-dicarboxylate transport system substrate-binding protein
MKKNCLWTMVAFLAVSALLLSGMAFAAPIKVRVSLCNAQTHPQSIGMQLFKKYVE